MTVSIYVVDVALATVGTPLYCSESMAMPMGMAWPWDLSPHHGHGLAAWPCHGVIGGSLKHSKKAWRTLWTAPKAIIICSGKNASNYKSDIHSVYNAYRQPELATPTGGMAMNVHTLTRTRTSTTTCPTATHAGAQPREGRSQGRGAPPTGPLSKQHTKVSPCPCISTCQCPTAFSTHLSKYLFIIYLAYFAPTCPPPTHLPSW